MGGEFHTGIDITLVEGDNRSINATVTTSVGESQDLSASTCTLIVVDDAGNTSTSEGSVGGVQNNVVTFALPDDVVGSSGRYRCQMKVVLGDDVRILPEGGNYGHIWITGSLFT